jgi:hypothetical protein
MVAGLGSFLYGLHYNHRFAHGNNSIHYYRYRCQRLPQYGYFPGHCISFARYFRRSPCQPLLWFFHYINAIRRNELCMVSGHGSFLYILHQPGIHAIRHNSLYCHRHGRVWLQQPGYSKDNGSSVACN